MKSPLLSIALFSALAFTAEAVTVIPDTAYGHNNRDNFGGNITDIYNGSGMNGYDWTNGQTNDYVAAPNDWPNAEGDPSTWTQTSGQYRDEWQADQLLDTNTSINGKVGWVILDLAADFQLQDMYLWNGVQIGTSAMEDFNIYYATEAGSPIIPATQGPTGGGDADDYDFGAAAWTQIGGLQTLMDGGSNSGVYAMNVTARYVAIEMMSRHSGNTDPNSGRIGFGEVAFTAIPEPSVALLSGLGILLLLRRKKH